MIPPLDLFMVTSTIISKDIPSPEISTVPLSSKYGLINNLQSIIPIKQSQILGILTFVNPQVIVKIMHDFNFCEATTNS